jgi:hypothetical protein
MAMFIMTTALFVLLVLFSVQTLSLFPGSAQGNVSIASTRNFFSSDNGERIGGTTTLPPALSILTSNNCTGELGIYIHGWHADEGEAIEQTERVFLSLQKSGYHIPIIGFSWDSNTEWGVSKIIANENGPILADFISEFKNQCPDDKLRIIAHSLGARVTLSAIQSLYNSNVNDSLSKPITSVHILGGAIDDEQVSLDNQYECTRINNPPLRCSGEAISSVVERLYSLYNPQDNMLTRQVIPMCPLCVCPYCWNFESSYFSEEGDHPLGAYPVKNNLPVPENYDEYSVMDEIGLNDDGDGDGRCDLEFNGLCTIIYTGDNHFGYMGYRSPLDRSTVTNSDVIQLVVSDWINEN